MTTPNSRQAIVFDLDDTLYAEMSYLRSAYRYIANQVSNDGSLYQRMLDKYQNNEDVFGYLSNDYQIDKSQLLDWYRYHLPEITLYDGVSEFLQMAKPHYQFAIITDGRSITQRNKINSLGLTPLITAMVISEEIGSEKPNPKNYLSVADQLNCENYWYIGDNLKKDFITPKQLGWQTICLKDQGENIHSQQLSVAPDYLPDYSFNNWQEIQHFFMKQ